MKAVLFPGFVSGVHGMTMRRHRRKGGVGSNTKLCASIARKPDGSSARRFDYPVVRETSNARRLPLCAESLISSRPSDMLQTPSNTALYSRVAQLSSSVRRAGRVNRRYSPSFTTTIVVSSAYAHRCRPLPNANGETRCRKQA